MAQQGFLGLAGRLCIVLVFGVKDLPDKFQSLSVQHVVDVDVVDIRHMGPEKFPVVQPIEDEVRTGLVVSNTENGVIHQITP